MTKIDTSAYEELVWRNARIAAKYIHMAKTGTKHEIDVSTELRQMGMSSDEVVDLLLGINDPEYDPTTMGYDDGPELGKDAEFDEGTYEEAKDAFRRIHIGKF